MIRIIVEEALLEIFLKLFLQTLNIELIKVPRGVPGTENLASYSHLVNEIPWNRYILTMRTLLSHEIFF